jgi:hypothetical protein
LLRLLTLKIYAYLPLLLKFLQKKHTGIASDVLQGVLRLNGAQGPPVAAEAVVDNAHGFQLVSHKK